MWYIVQPCDTINSISTKFKVSVEQLRNANCLINKEVSPGQRVWVCTSERQQNTYVVAPEDNLYSIAEKFSTTVEVLKELNNLTGDLVLPGQQLIISAPIVIPESSETLEAIRLGDEMAIFKDHRAVGGRKNVTIYKIGDSIYYMSKMAIDEGRRTSLCRKVNGRCVEHVNTYQTPFYVLPQNTAWAGLGDFGVVINTRRDNKLAYAIFADWGPKETRGIRRTELVGTLGEGSVALGRSIDITGIRPNPLSAYQLDGILYIVFPGSGEGQGKLKKIEEINNRGAELFGQWGGMEQVNTILQNHYRESGGM
ncbi:MAG: LysM peptidoglycan-binding domain-containing protein [Clostridia bacterium]|nr:LysM peptidoglycan-binding domain-containing protein [Clostridia bacterium]